MEASTETAVRREIAIAASPETVWEFLVQPEKATRWMGEAASLDPRPGGEYRVEVISGNVALGEFVEVDPPHRLVWTWGWTDQSQSPVPAGLDQDRGGARAGRRRHAAALHAQRAAGRRRDGASTRTAGTTTWSGSRSPRAGTTRAATPGLTE